MIKILKSQSKKNILHLLNGEQYSGLERVVEHLSEHAPDYGYRFHLVLLKSGEMLKYFCNNEAIVHFAPMKTRYDFSAASVVRKIIKKTNSQLIHSHTVRSALIARIVKEKTKITWCHHIHSPARYESEKKILPFINYLIEKYILKKADCLLPVSGALEDYILSNYRIPRSKITTVYNGVPKAEIGLSEPRLGSNLTRIGVVGLFRPRKGIEVLIKALKILLKWNTNFELRLIGSFSSYNYRKNIKKLVNELGLTSYVKFTGFKRDVKQELKNIDIIVIPSLYGEGLPMVLLEAMAHRRVIIASAVQGISEVLSNGKHGILVPPNEPFSLAQAIEIVINNPSFSLSLAENAQSYQRAMYSTDTMAQGVFDVYNRYTANN